MPFSVARGTPDIRRRMTGLAKASYCNRYMPSFQALIYAAESLFGFKAAEYRTSNEPKRADRYMPRFQAFIYMAESLFSVNIRGLYIT